MISGWWTAGRRPICNRGRKRRVWLLETGIQPRVPRCRWTFWCRHGYFAGVASARRSRRGAQRNCEVVRSGGSTARRDRESSVHRKARSGGIRTPRAGMALTLLGAAYLLVPFQQARTCLGMECLEFLVSAMPVAVLSVPWGFSAKWLPPDPDVVEASVYRGQLLHVSYWPRYAVVSAGFLLNLFLVGAGLESFWRRRLTNRGGGSGATSAKG